MSTRRMIAIVLSALFCLIPLACAALAWINHFIWLTDAYAYNSFPMNRLATQLTWVAGAVVLCVALAWSVFACCRSRP